MTATEFYSHLLVMATTDAVLIVAALIYCRYKKKQKEKQLVWETLKQ